MAEVCRYGPALSALLDGELGEAKQRRVTGHLSRCATCEAELADLRRIRAQVRSLPAREVPEGLWESARVAAQRGQEHRPGRDVERLAIVGMLVAAVFAGALAWGSSEEPQRTVETPEGYYASDPADPASGPPLITPLAAWD